MVFAVATASVSYAANTYDFADVRYGKAGTVTGGGNPTFTFDSKTSTATTSNTATYTLTADFDGDGVADSLSFTLVATTASGVVYSNKPGYVGVDNPRLDQGEALTFNILLPESVSLSGGGTGTASFNGFSGGTMGGGVTGGYTYAINGDMFTSREFRVADVSRMEIANVADIDALFVIGINFGMTVVVP